MVAPKKTPVKKPAAKTAAPLDLESIVDLPAEELSKVQATNDAPMLDVAAAQEAEAKEPSEVDLLRAELAAMRQLLAQGEQPKAAPVVPVAPVEPPKPAQVNTHWKDGEVIHLHFIADGFIALGDSWYRGQELKITVGGPEWNSTVDRNGNTWLDLVDNINAQYAKYGKQFFALGPWPGKKWDEVAPTDFEIREKEDLSYYAAAAQQAAAKEAKRDGRAMNVTFDY